MIGGYCQGVIYCASQSPQRAMLLRQAGVTFTVVATTGDEETVTAVHPQRLALDRAQVKARGAMLPPYADGVIIGADTVVALGTTVFGKPSDDQDAARILRSLQGTTHSVLTGHHAIRVSKGVLGAEACGLAVARVTMRSMSDADIAAYLATGEHRGRAGAYAIQETGDRFVIDVEGSWGTVVGLSLTTVGKLVRELTDAPLAMTATEAKTRLFQRPRP